jgi:hypothetical protein
VDKNDTKTHFKLKGTNPNWAKSLRTFGEIDIVYTKQSIRNKFTNHGEPCMFIGYAENHTSNVFKFYNPKTRACLMSRNVYCLNKSYGEFYKVRSDTGHDHVNQAHRMMADVDFDLPDVKYPPSNAVARAMLPHFHPFQAPDPNDI